MFARGLARPIAIAATAVAIGGGAYGIVSATANTGSGTTATTSSISATSAQRVPGSAGSNARSGPAAGGSSGTVETISKSSFMILTSAGQKVTVRTASSTKYRAGTAAISASAIKKGMSVLVLGRTSATTITAGKIIVQSNDPGPAPSSAAEVVPFKRGAQSTSKQAGQIPASYSQGSGTIVSGTPAERATEAALAAYPGGVVDRVVKLSNHEYEVHNIGVNWPHHIFVSQDYKILGAD